jgi:hypothetical protein
MFAWQLFCNASGQRMRANPVTCLPVGVNGNFRRILPQPQKSRSSDSGGLCRVKILPPCSVVEFFFTHGVIVATYNAPIMLKIYMRKIDI